MEKFKLGQRMRIEDPPPEGEQENSDNNENSNDK